MSHEELLIVAQIHHSASGIFAWSATHELTQRGIQLPWRVGLTPEPNRLSHQLEDIQQHT